jgi:lipopolysaccharide/colanic/teichoic acid biosynthesis glycosyltransferase
MRDTALTLEPRSLAVAHRGDESRATAVACRALDLVIATIALIVLALPLLVIAIAIRLDSRGGTLFRQERLGRDLRPFMVNKFRTMHTGTSHDEHREFVQRLIAGEAERHQGAGNKALFKLASDARVTRVGGVLRRTSLDELPQLLNVLRGEMSLVGPRPPLDYEVERYPERAFGRFAGKPGITGWWQVSGRSELTFEEMIELDLEYLRRRSFWFNVQILARTLPVVLCRKGAA